MCPKSNAAQSRGPLLRQDAQRNLEKLKAAALELFRERGLGVALEEIALRAEVSTGTLYNRFGTSSQQAREALIDAVLPELAAINLREALEEAQRGATSWDRFTLYVRLLGEMQARDPALNDVVSRKYPEAQELGRVCDGARAVAKTLIKEAQRDGFLRADFTSDDLFVVLWSNAQLIRATATSAPGAWRRNISFVLDGLRAAAAHPLPVAAKTRSHARPALIAAGRQDAAE